MASTMMSPREAQLTQEVEALRQENKLLREKVDALIKRLFGASSEKLDANQLLLLLQGDDGPKKPKPPAQVAPPWRLNWPNPPRAIPSPTNAGHLSPVCPNTCLRWKRW
jgi:hypothetical protein